MAAAPHPADASPYPTMAGLDKEIMSIALPMLATLAADPVAGLVDSAYLGHAGAVQLAAVGVALSIFNTCTKIFNVPLLAVTTSSVARATGLAQRLQAAAAAAEGQAGKHTGAAGQAEGRGSGPGHAPTAAAAVGAHGGSGSRAEARVSGGSSSSSSSSTSAGCPAAGASPTGESKAAAALHGAAPVHPPDPHHLHHNPDQQHYQQLTARAQARSASSCLLLAAVVGLLQAVVLLAAGPALVRMWGVTHGSPVYGAAMAFLAVRAAGAPVTILMLTLQGVYRGLQDTRTPFQATLVSNAINIALAPVLIFGAGLGAGGAALGTVCAQAIPLALMLRDVSGRLPLVGVWRSEAAAEVQGGGAAAGAAEVQGGGAGPATVQGGGAGAAAVGGGAGGGLAALVAAMAEVVPLFKPTGFLMVRSLSVTATYAVATSLVARAGTAVTASHQICFQLWLAASLLADALAVAAQSLMARDLGAGARRGAQQVAARVSSLCLGLGLALAALMAAGGSFLPQLFSSDPAVLQLVRGLFPLLALTQPINVMAMTWDGILYGAGGFRYAALSMAAAAGPAILAMQLGAAHIDAAAAAAAGTAAGAAATAGGEQYLQVVWRGLSLLMLLRWATISLPYALRIGPFARLRKAGEEEGAAPA